MMICDPAAGAAYRMEFKLFCTATILRFNTLATVRDSDWGIGFQHSTDAPTDMPFDENSCTEGSKHAEHAPWNGLSSQNIPFCVWFSEVNPMNFDCDTSPHHVQMPHRGQQY
jgi:hypothetical protein